MNHPKGRGILFFGLTEIAIGAITLSSVLVSLFLYLSQKPLNVLVFVITASVISIILGAGILLRKIHSLHMLLFFASMIIVSKILIFARIISLHGALETAVPEPMKNIISLGYHSAVILYFSSRRIRANFN